VSQTGQVNSPEDSRIIRQRAEKAVADLVRPLANSIRPTLLAAVLAVIGGVDVGLITRQPALAGLTTAAITAASAALIWTWLLDPERRAGLELLFDHDCHERWEWKQDTGTNLPRNAKAARVWLEDHPTGDGRAALLVRLGRLVEADAAIAAIEPRTPEEAFGVEILRKTREQMAGDRPDLSALHASWRSLPDLRERRHQRECLAILDALIAVGERRDPWSILAQARADIGEVHRSMRMPWLAARWAAYQLLIVGFTVGVTFALVS
jgi:hypothetical protein